MSAVTTFAVLLPQRRRQWHTRVLSQLQSEEGCTLRTIADISQAADAEFILDLRPNGGGSEADPRIWRFSFGTTPSLPFAGEIAAGARTIGVSLRCSAGTLREGRFPVESSYARTWAQVARHIAEWPAWCLRAIREGRSGAVRADAPRARALTPLLLARFAMRQCTLFVRGAISRLFVEHAWDVGIVAARPQDALTGLRKCSVHWLHPRTKRPFYADPFALPGSQGLRILCERLSSRDRLGRIVELTLDENSGAIDERDAITDAHGHLSYPFVLAHDGALYCVPENAEGGSVRAFPAENASFGAPLPLLEGVAACDATLVQHGGRWWLFCTRRDGGANLALYLYHSASPMGPWSEHRANPVKIDIAGARPAGPFFTCGSALYRPAQDCSSGYGGAIVLHRIVHLDEKQFSEETVARIEAFDARYPHGAHTLCFLPDGRALVDGKREYFSLKKPLSVLRGRAARKSVGLRDAIPANRLRQAALAFPLRWTHRRAWREPRMSRICSGPYYIDWSAGCGTFGEDWDVMPRDAEGVLLTLRGALYHPIDIAQFALHCHAAWQEKRDVRSRDAFLAQAAWLRDNQASRNGIDGLYLFPFPWPKYGAAAGWVSAMAQGEAISVLLRAHADAPDRGFDRAAKNAAQPFRHSIQDGGVVFRDGADCFLEECAVLPAPHILNGCIFAFWGLWELQQADPQPWLAELIDDVGSTLHRWLPRFENGWWTRYSLQRSRAGREHLATLKYHAFHIAQMRVLGVMTGQRDFTSAADRWELHVKRAESRARLLFETAFALPERLADA